MGSRISIKRLCHVCFSFSFSFFFFFLFIQKILFDSVLGRKLVRSWSEDLLRQKRISVRHHEVCEHLLPCLGGADWRHQLLSAVVIQRHLSTSTGATWRQLAHCFQRQDPQSQRLHR